MSMESSQAGTGLDSMDNITDSRALYAERFSAGTGLAVSGCIAGDSQDAYLWGFGTTSQLGKGENLFQHTPATLSRAMNHCN